MAYSTVANVKKATANADLIPGPHQYQSVKVVNGANAGTTVTLRKTNVSGAIIWQSGSMAANAVASDPSLEIHLAAIDIYVEMSAAGATVFLYSC